MMVHSSKAAGCHDGKLYHPASMELLFCYFVFLPGNNFLWDSFKAVLVIMLGLALERLQTASSKQATKAQL